MDTMPGEASMNFMGALALGDRLPYMSPVSEPELYMWLLNIIDQQHACNHIGRYLLNYPCDLACKAGVLLL